MAAKKPNNPAASARMAPSPRVPVPDVSNQTIDQAISILQAAQLAIEIFIGACGGARSTPRTPTDGRIVRSQCTAPNDTVAVGSLVGVVVDP
ncbi:MAG: PASTA domain-containing protein [Planctomycetota bacterium]